MQRTAIVTGAGRGIGRAISVALGRLGYRVIVNYHSNQEAADQCVKLVEDAGGATIQVRADVGDGADRRRLVDTALEQTGRIDLLVNNAARAPRVRVDLLEMTEQSYDEVMDAGLKGPLFLSQRVAGQMIRQIAAGVEGPFSIVNIGSISAYAASVQRGEYCIAKAGLAMTTKLFAARLADDGIGVYEVRPGIVETDMTAGVKEKYDRLILEEGITPIRRWGRPEDVALAVTAVAEGRLPFSTGEVLNVDGGFHLRRL